MQLWLRSDPLPRKSIRCRKAKNDKERKEERKKEKEKKERKKGKKEREKERERKKEMREGRKGVLWLTQ